MKASIIIPSYNACERLYYNLLSLNMQSSDKNEFEVIVVDNASKDDTKSMLRHFNANFELRTIFLNVNKGRAYARNCAIEKSQGELLIFHDSDMIAKTDYVYKHINYHNEENLVVVGRSWDRIFAYYYKEFEGDLRNNFNLQLEKQCFSSCKNYTDLQPLINEDDIFTEKCFENAFVLNKYQNAINAILRDYGSDLNGYYFPWSLFITNNCSADKNTVLKVGAFDDAFVTWGCEDIDLGYRLYKAGCYFIKDDDIQSLHQEHPIDSKQSCSQNIYYFTNKYNEIDLLLFYYGSYANINKAKANVVLSELELIKTNDSFTSFIELYRKMLINLRDANCDEGKCKNLKEKMEIRRFIASNEENIRAMLHFIETEKTLTQLASSFKVLLKKTLSINNLKYML